MAKKTHIKVRLVPEDKPNSSFFYYVKKPAGGEKAKIRSELDKLDNTLLKVIKKRTILVNKVLALKDKKNQIVDKKRITLILKNIKKKSIKNKIDPKITNRIWKNMIWSYVDFERRNFKKK